MKQSKKKLFSDRPFSQRQQLSLTKLKQQPNYIPVVLKPGKYTPSLCQKRYTIQKNLKILDVIGTFQRDKHMWKDQKGFYLFTTMKKKMLKNTDILRDVYEMHKSQDGWLYLQYDQSQVF